MENKLTDNEIIKAIDRCASIGESCEDCPFYEYTDCDERLKECYHDLIKRKDTEIDVLIRKKGTLRDEISELRAENERLKGDLAFREKQLDNLVKEMTE